MLCFLWRCIDRWIKFCRKKLCRKSVHSMATVHDVFVQGKYQVADIVVDGEDPLSPPKPLLIVHPTEEGLYPTLVFLHGFSLQNSMYSQLLHHVASHGFTVVAPQLDNILRSDWVEDIKSVAATVDWLPAGLQPKLPEEVRPDLTRLAIAGHSWGGKLSFALSLGIEAKPRLAFSALLGIEPSDGTAPGVQIDPPVLTFVPDSLDPKVPVLVVGAALSSVKREPELPACAPEGVNHEEFFKESVAPVFYAVARDYGHVDMLDESVPVTVCAGGDNREALRRFVGGIMVAFLKAYLILDADDLNKIFEMPDRVSPVVLSTVEVKKN
ncbi:hypothetical protein EJ110_NYTH45797 [Nymphaea thermarum]|nr:hypothetical protein EJ110_NYTH45797 [Nymphaea thermarum]